jgi:hypothetical protein
MQRVELAMVNCAIKAISAWLLELSRLKLEIEKEMEKPRLIRIK